MGAINHKERGHARLSPSSSHRWMNCPASVLLIESMPVKEDEGSVFSAEGTFAHEVAENNLKLWKEGRLEPCIDDMQVTDDMRNSEFYSPELLRYVSDYVNFVDEEFYEMCKVNKPFIFIEDKVTVPHVKSCFGSIDMTLVNREKLHIIDLKYGKGVRVDADGNSQLMMYALGALQKHKKDFPAIKTVQMTIAQVRLNHYPTFEMSVKDLERWGINELREKAKLAEDGTGDTCIGSWCRFCPARPICKKQYDAIKDDFEEETDPLLMTDDEIVDMLGKLDQYRGWLSAFDQYVYKEAMRGRKWKGYKLIEGRTTRKIKDPDTVREELLKTYLEDEVLNVSLKGITDLQKLMGKRKFDAVVSPHLVSQAGAPKLVPESQEGIEYSSLSDFDVED